MSTEAQPVYVTEGYREKALRKFKQQPLVPIGTLLFSPYPSVLTRPSIPLIPNSFAFRASRRTGYDRGTHRRDDQDA